MKKIITVAILSLFTVHFSLSTCYAQVHVDAVADSAGEIFTVVEEDPEFPGGQQALYQYIAANVNYPQQAKEQGVTGRVFVSFVVERDGSISNIKSVKCPNQLLCDEAVRVVQSMPRWKPGRQRGKRVRVQYMLPFNFTL